MRLNSPISDSMFTDWIELLIHNVCVYLTCQVKSYEVKAVTFKTETFKVYLDHLKVNRCLLIDGIMTKK